tara:strand:- start:469 stop:660 length:192 start_codon:yes stop_codon:yes gene_type:complete
VRVCLFTVSDEGMERVKGIRGCGGDKGIKRNRRVIQDEMISAGINGKISLGLRCAVGYDVWFF